MTDTTLAPGIYSAFVLKDNGTWEQPSFRVPAGYTEREIERFVEHVFGGFYVCALNEDHDFPDNMRPQDLGITTKAGPYSAGYNDT